MPKVDLMPEYRANLPRTGHSLSHDLAFTATTAHLLPVFHDFLNAGESVTLGFDFHIRTQPLEAAAMSKIKCHTEYFFVPMQMLYQGFSDWYYGIREEFSSRFSVNGELAEFKLPKLNLSDVENELFTNRASSFLGSGNLRVQTGECVGKSAYRLFDILGIPPHRIARGVTDKSLGNIFPYQILAYNCIYQNYYRLDTRELFVPDSFNVDQYFSSGTISYTNFAKYCLLHRRPYDNDYFKDIKVSPIVDGLNLNNKTDLQVASQYITRGSQLQQGYPGDANYAPFYDGYGIDDKIATQFGFSQRSDANTASVDNSGLSIDRNSPYVDSSGNLVSTGLNPLSYNGTPGTSSHGYIYVDDNGSKPNIFHNHNLSGTATVDIPTDLIDIGTANIRAMFASEKLWSVTGRAKKNYDDQTLAHFGFKVPHDPKHQISCFGHDVTDISIGEVISTANTGSSGSPLGEIAGKGYAAQGSQRHKFTAPCHGVVMAIFSIVPEIYYDDTFAKWNKISDRDDLYTPEYDHLGMQPLFGYEAGYSPAQSDPAQILGWQYRYEQWKRRYNRCTSIFSSSIAGGGSLSSWFHTEPSFQGTISNSVLDSPNTVSAASFLTLPNSLNDIFLYGYVTNWSSQYESTPYAIYEGDPFVVSSHIDCVKVSTMSDYSLPRLDA